MTALRPPLRPMQEKTAEPHSRRLEKAEETEGEERGTERESNKEEAERKKGEDAENGDYDSQAIIHFAGILRAKDATIEELRRRATEVTDGLQSMRRKLAVYGGEHRWLENRMLHLQMCLEERETLLLEKEIAVQQKELEIQQLTQRLYEALLRNSDSHVQPPLSSSSSFSSSPTASSVTSPTSLFSSFRSTSTTLQSDHHNISSPLFTSSKFLPPSFLIPSIQTSHLRPRTPHGERHNSPETITNSIFPFSSLTQPDALLAPQSQRNPSTLSLSISHNNTELSSPQTAKPPPPHVHSSAIFSIASLQTLSSPPQTLPPPSRSRQLVGAKLKGATNTSSDFFNSQSRRESDAQKTKSNQVSDKLSNSPSFNANIKSGATAMHFDISTPSTNSLESLQHFTESVRRTAISTSLPSSSVKQSPRLSLLLSFPPNPMTLLGHENHNQNVKDDHNYNTDDPTTTSTTIMKNDTTPATPSHLLHRTLLRKSNPSPKATRTSMTSTTTNERCFSSFPSSLSPLSSTCRRRLRRPSHSFLQQQPLRRRHRSIHYSWLKMWFRSRYPDFYARREAEASAVSSQIVSPSFFKQIINPITFHSWICRLKNLFFITRQEVRRRLSGTDIVKKVADDRTY